MAAFWLLGLSRHDLSFLSRLGYVSALCCVIGFGIFFWVDILIFAATRREWSYQDCQYILLLIIIPGCILFLAGGFSTMVANILLFEVIFVKLRFVKLLFPNATDSPFEKDPPLTLFGR